MIKKMKKFITFILLTIVIQSCNTLSHTKKTYVHQFAASTKDLPKYSLKFNQTLSNVRKSRGIYFANTLSTPSLHLTELDSIYAQQKLDERKTILFQNSFEILNTYSKILLALSSDVYVDDLYNNIKELEYERQLVRAGIAANLISCGISKELISQTTKLTKREILNIQLYLNGE